MDQGGSSLGLAPFMRCHTDKLPLMNSVHAFQIILYLLFRTLSVLLCSSREVPSSGLYGRRSSAQSKCFLIINIHNIGAKVRAVELTGKKVLTPAASFLCTLSLGLKGYQNCILLEHRGHLLKHFGCRRAVQIAFLCWLKWGRFRAQCDRRPFSSETQP